MIVTECWQYPNERLKYKYMSYSLKDGQGFTIQIMEYGGAYSSGMKHPRTHKDLEIDVKEKCLNCKWGLRHMVNKCKREFVFTEYKSNA